MTKSNWIQREAEATAGGSCFVCHWTAATGCNHDRSVEYALSHFLCALRAPSPEFCSLDNSCYPEAHTLYLLTMAFAPSQAPAAWKVGMTALVLPPQRHGPSQQTLRRRQTARSSLASQGLAKDTGIAVKTSFPCPAKVPASLGAVSKEVHKRHGRGLDCRPLLLATKVIAEIPRRHLRWFAS